MTFTFDPARSLLILGVIILVATAASLLLGRRSPLRKALGLVAAVAFSALFVSRYHESSLTVDDAGIWGDVYGRPSVLWPDVESARWIENLMASEYQPRVTIRSSFRVFGYARARYGRFDISDGEQALFAVQQFNGPALLIVTRDAKYVFAPKDVRGLVRAVARHVAVAGFSAARGKEPPAAPPSA